MHLARYAIDPAAAPPLTETLPFAETARRCLMGVYGRISARDGVKGLSPVISGRTTDGARLSGHGHCHYLPSDEDGDGRLDHLTLHAPDGFGPEEVRALHELRLVKPRRDATGAGPPVPVALVGLGRADEFRPAPARVSSAWLSATPFLAPEHPKTRGRFADTERGGRDPRRFLLAQMEKELGRWVTRRGVAIDPGEVGIELLCDEDGRGRRVDPATGGFREPVTAFRRFRQKRGDDGGRRLAGFFHLTFPEPVPGPLALGYHSHFGMGLFLPVD